jgi:hypothetical protein
MAKQCITVFFLKLTRGMLISWLIFYSRLVLTNTKPLHFINDKTILACFL